MKSGITTSTLCRVGWLVWRFCGRNVCVCDEVGLMQVTVIHMLYCSLSMEC